MFACDIELRKRTRMQADHMSAHTYARMHQCFRTIKRNSDNDLVALKFLPTLQRLTIYEDYLSQLVSKFS